MNWAEDIRRFPASRTLAGEKREPVGDNRRFSTARLISASTGDVPCDSALPEV
jgi:hypothetical protein